ncbi:MAG: hypothetical protein O7G85_14455 [Planctomycetota bacterium]|nr:hypothetical protein [Planctomycetota bacterium]
MAQIEILSEDERNGGWVFDTQILDAQGSLFAVTLSLSWADYNLWSSDGADTPGAVAEAALLFLVSRMPSEEIRTSFDASLIRRLFTDTDKVIPGFIRRSL